MLTLCGAPEPTEAERAAALAVGLDDVRARYPNYAGTLVQKEFTVPVANIGVAETVMNGFVDDALGAQDHLMFFSPYSLEPCLAKAAKEFLESQADGVAAGLTATEATNAAVCSTDGVSPLYDEYSLYAGAEAAAAQSAQEAAAEVLFHGGALGLRNEVPNAVLFLPTQEETALARAEWVTLPAAFLNLESMGRAHFSFESTQYEATRLAAAEAGAVDAATGITAPAVVWVESREVGYGEPPSYVVKQALYQEEMTRDAGARFPTVADLPGGLPDFQGNVQYGWNGPDQGADAAAEAESRAAAAAALLQDVRAWAGADALLVLIDETFVADPADADQASFQATWCLDNGACGSSPAAPDADLRAAVAGATVLREDRRVADLDVETYGFVPLAWFESLVAFPSRGLADLVSVVRPAAAPQGWRRVYLRDIRAGESVIVVESDLCRKDLDICTEERHEQEHVGASGAAGWGAAASAVVAMVVAFVAAL